VLHEDLLDNNGYVVDIWKAAQARHMRTWDEVHTFLAAMWESHGGAYKGRNKKAAEVYFLLKQVAEWYLEQEYQQRQEHYRHQALKALMSDK